MVISDLRNRLFCGTRSLDWTASVRTKLAVAIIVLLVSAAPCLADPIVGANTGIARRATAIEGGSNGLALGPGAPVYNSVWPLTLAPARALALDDFGAQVKAVHSDSTGGNAGQTSYPIILSQGALALSPLPLPSTLALLGTCLLGLCGLIRRRLTK